jgi:hypothetical protein
MEHRFGQRRNSGSPAWPGLGERVLRVFDSAETGYEKPHPEAVRRVIRTGRGRFEYRNSASAMAIKKIRRSCHNRFPAGVFMSKPRETLEAT